MYIEDISLVELMYALVYIEDISLVELYVLVELMYRVY